MFSWTFRKKVVVAKHPLRLVSLDNYRVMGVGEVWRAAHKDEGCRPWDHLRAGG